MFLKICYAFWYEILFMSFKALDKYNIIAQYLALLTVSSHFFEFVHLLLFACFGNYESYRFIVQ
ncbi:hypothetical protein MIDIC_340003 [Alphaproteobacteria bacterium]